MINRFYSACPQLIGKGLSRVNSRLVKISYILFVLYHKIPVSTASALVFFTNDRTTQHILFMEWFKYGSFARFMMGSK